jgi:hypothetical protein
MAGTGTDAGPTVQVTPQVRVAPRPMPVDGKKVYRKGMRGVLQKALALTTILQKSKKDGAVVSTSLLQVKSLLLESQKTHNAIVSDFVRMDKEMQSMNVDPIMRQRLKKTRAGYESQYGIFKEHVMRLNVTSGKKLKQVEVDRAVEFLKQVQPHQFHKSIDPNRLPWRRATPIKRKPLLTSKAYADFYGWSQVNGGIPINNPTADDLKESKEVTLTTEIKALATRLKTPLAIYKWVHDNIRFSPTFGSLQGAEYCRQTKACNAHDTASLLIALLRAQKVPARYVFGTIVVPIEEARNWVGNFKANSGGAVSRALLSSGVPAAGLIAGGKTKAVRMEHVWVEAWIDYMPSRGRVHREGDTWIPMDPSYKQHVYSAGADPYKAGGIDSKSLKALADTFKKGGQVDALGGLTKAPDYSPIETYRKNASKKLNDFFKGKTVDSKDIIKQGVIKTFDADFFPASLNYKIVAIGQRIAEIPDQMRHYVTIMAHSQLSPPGIWGTSSDGPADFRYKIAMCEILGKVVVLTYKPATQVDADTLEKYLIQAQVGGPPKVPAVVKLQPVLVVGEKIVATGKTTNFGATNRINIEFKKPSQTDKATHTVTAGSTNAIVINPGRVSGEQYDAVKKRLEHYKSIVNKNDPKDLPKLRKAMGTARFLFAAGLLYWVTQDKLALINSANSGVKDIRLSAVGLFSTAISTTYGGFGPYQTPRYVEGGRLATDINHDLHAIVSFDNNNQTEVKHFLNVGMAASAFEATIWEIMKDAKKADVTKGATTAHMLQYAAKTGVPIYTLTKQNISSVLPKLSLSSAVINDIKNGVAVGKHVVTPAREMKKDGWKGVGYLIFDPKTGAGAYLISGGLAGGSSFSDLYEKYYKDPLLDIWNWIGGSLKDPSKTFSVIFGVLGQIIGKILGPYNMASSLGKIGGSGHVGLTKFYMAMAVISLFLLTTLVGALVAGAVIGGGWALAMIAVGVVFGVLLDLATGN